MKVKALSLWQPHASLVAHRLKGVETRSWSTSYRGPLLIHAARRYEVDVYHALWQRFPEVRDAWLGEPPRGALVAVARLVDVRFMAHRETRGTACLPPPGSIFIEDQTPLERAVGDWQPGRYGWVLEDVQRLDPPIPFRGRQGLFEVDVDYLPQHGRRALAALTVPREGDCRLCRAAVPLGEGAVSREGFVCGDAAACARRREARA